jgi:hypothetical protein
MAYRLVVLVGQLASIPYVIELTPFLRYKLWFSSVACGA